MEAVLARILNGVDEVEAGNAMPFVADDPTGAKVAPLPQALRLRPMLRKEKRRLMRGISKKTMISATTPSDQSKPTSVLL